MEARGCASSTTIGCSAAEAEDGGGFEAHRLPENLVVRERDALAGLDAWSAHR